MDGPKWWKIFFDDVISVTRTVIYNAADWTGESRVFFYL